MLDFLTACWLGIIGACIGSFLNVVAYRMPLGMSVIWKPSHCPACGHDIRGRDNVPVLGWLWLRGRCRDCGVPISPRYAIVEAVMGAAFFTLAYAELFLPGAGPSGAPLSLTADLNPVWNPNWPLLLTFAFHATLLCLLMCAALIALDDEAAPGRLILFGVGILLAAMVRWRLDHAVAFPAGGGDQAGVRAALGLIAGNALALVAAQVTPQRMLAERDAKRRNLSLALGMTGGFLGLEALALVGAAAALATVAYGAARQRRGEFFRTLPAAVFAVAWAYLALSRHLPS